MAKRYKVDGYVEIYCRDIKTSGRRSGVKQADKSYYGRVKIDGKRKMVLLGYKSDGLTPAKAANIRQKLITGLPVHLPEPKKRKIKRIAADQESSSWNELLSQFDREPNDIAKQQWLRTNQLKTISGISKLRGGRNVIFYASSFLSKPDLPPMDLQLTHEDLNGFMSVMQGMQWKDNLTLILHTPGGVTNAAETIVAYLHSNFQNIEVIIPTYAMSAGTMIALSSNKIIMGRQSQLGPIDSLMPMNGRTVSARAIVNQFERARTELTKNIKHAHLWAPILQNLGPALLQEAQNALNYSENMVKKWLVARMFAGKQNADDLATDTAAFFNHASLHKSHGRRIDREEARKQNLIIEDLETNQSFQEAVLTAYHLMTIAFEKSPATKVLLSNHNHMWVKNMNITYSAPSFQIRNPFSADRPTI